MSPSTIFHPDHDLRLQVRQENATASFLVCSRALAMASPVFKRMLFGGWKESKPDTGEWVVQLPDENISGLKTVMNIIHLNFQKVTNLVQSAHSSSCDKLSHNCGCDIVDPLESLYAVTIVLDKYDLLHIIQPWAQMWLRRARRDNHSYSWYLGQRPELPWVAWVFGSKRVLQKKLDAAVLSVFLVDKERDRDSHGNASDDNTGIGTQKNRELSMRVNLELPEVIHTFNHIFGFLGIADQVAELRLELLASLLKPLRSLFHQRMVHLYRLCDSVGTQLDDGVSKRSTGPSMPEDDDIPLIKAEQYSGSVIDLFDQLNDTFLRTVTEEEREYTGLKEKINAKWQEIKESRPFVELSEAQEAHLERQRANLQIPQDGDYDSDLDDMYLDFSI